MKKKLRHQLRNKPIELTLKEIEQYNYRYMVFARQLKEE